MKSVKSLAKKKVEPLSSCKIDKLLHSLSRSLFVTISVVDAMPSCHRMSKGVREAPGKALIGELAAESGDKTEGAFGELHCQSITHANLPYTT